jgi:hypothetical protein
LKIKYVSQLVKYLYNNISDNSTIYSNINGFHRLPKIMQNCEVVILKGILPLIKDNNHVEKWPVSFIIIYTRIEILVRCLQSVSNEVLSFNPNTVKINKREKEISVNTYKVSKAILS